MAASELFNKILLNESQEQLNELSNDTLPSLNKKANAHLDDISRKRGPKKASDKRSIQKRGAGIDKAAAIKAKRRAAERDAFSKKSHAAFEQAAHKVLTDHGYELMHSGNLSNIYTKHDPDTNTLHVAEHHIGNPSTQDRRRNLEGEIKLVSTNGTTSTIRNPGGFNLYSQFRNNPDINLGNHHAEKIDDELKNHHMRSSNEVFNKHLNEEVLNENWNGKFGSWSGRTPHPDFASAHSTLVNAGYKRTKTYPKYQHKIHEYEKDGNKIKLTANAIEKKIQFSHGGKNHDVKHLQKFLGLNEEVEIGEASGEEYRKKLLNYQSPARKKWIADQMKKKSATNEEVELTEGRGRPRKDGTKTEGDDRPHIIMQLRKHISLRGANPIKFADGSARKITDGQARAALVLHQNLKSSIEKGNFEKKLDASHNSFQSALKSPETAGHDTPKPGITLPALNRINRLKFASGE